MAIRSLSNPSDLLKQPLSSHLSSYKSLGPCQPLSATQQTEWLTGKEQRPEHQRAILNV